MNLKNCVKLPNGLEMPVVGLKLWRSEDVPAEAIAAEMEKALEAGYRHFDASVLRNNEEGLGVALKKFLDSGKITREEIFISAKLPWIGLHPGRVSHFIISSLNRLQLDYVDLYLVHWPVGAQYTHDEDRYPMSPEGTVMIDPSTNLEATWRSIEHQVDIGRARSIGVSNFNPGQLDRIMSIARIPPAVHQFEIHAHFQNKEWIQATRQHNVSVCACSPLAGSPNGSDINLIQDPVVLKIAKQRGKTPAQILLRFLLQLDVTVLAKSGPNLAEYIDIFDTQLNEQEMAALEGIDKGGSARSTPLLPGMEDHPEFPF